MNQHELNVEAEAIRELACKVFNWPRSEVDKFSLSSLKFIAQPKPGDGAKKLVDAIDNWQKEWGGR